MDRKIIVGLLAWSLFICGTTYYAATTYHSNKAQADYTTPIMDFSVKNEQIIKDLDGVSVNMLYGQVWPFDSSQSTKVNVIEKKRVDQVLVVVTEVESTVKISQEETKKDDKPTMLIQSSADPNKSKPLSSVKGEQPKTPDKVTISGVAKLYYEYLGGKWYLVNTEGITLKTKNQVQ